MAEKEEARRVMRPRAKALQVILAAALIAGVVLGAFLYGAKRGSLKAAPVVTSDLLGQQLRAVEELVSVSYHYTNMARYENQLDFYGWKVPFTTKTFIVSYDGIIKAGVDLSKAEVEMDGAENRITVTLPGSQIISHEIPEDSIEVFDESDNVFNRISITDYTSFTGDQKAAMEQRVLENGLLASADEKAMDAVESLLRYMPGLENYTLCITRSDQD